MANQNTYYPFPVEPMTAFYAAVTAVENGRVGEVELEFRKELEEYEIVMTMIVRRKSRPMVSHMLKEDNG